MLKNKTKICQNATFHAISKSLHYIKVLRLSNRCRGLARLLASSFKNSKYIRSKGDDSNVELEPIFNTKNSFKIPSHDFNKKYVYNRQRK